MGQVTKMKKKILLSLSALILTAAAGYLLILLPQTKRDSNRFDSVTEQDRKMPETDGTGDVMIWESLSRHFMTFN